MEDLPKSNYPMLCDDDLVFLIKSKNVPHANEWLFRQYQMKPLWKSYYEFKRLFGQSISTSIQRIKHCLNPIFGDEENYLIIEQTENKQVINNNRP